MQPSHGDGEPFPSQGLGLPARAIAEEAVRSTDVIVTMLVVVETAKIAVGR